MSEVKDTTSQERNSMPDQYVEQPPSVTEKVGDTDYVVYDLDIAGSQTRVIFHSRLTTPGIETHKHVHVTEPENFGDEKVEEITYSQEEVGLPGFIVPEHLTVVNNSILYRREGKIDSSREAIVYDTDTPKDILVETGLEALLKTAAILGADTSDVRAATLQARHQSAGSELTHFSEMLMAAKLINQDGEFSAMEDNLNAGEVLFLKSLCGDPEAGEELSRRLEVLKTIFPDSRKEMSEIEGTPEVMSPKEIALVHLTKYKPENDKKGHRVIRPLMTNMHESKGVKPRTTIHFTLNHPVESHMYGNWDGAGYVYIAPLSNVIENNEVPASLNSVDTFFDVGPFGEIKLDGSEVFMIPGSVNTGQLYRSGENGELHYRTNNFDKASISRLIELMNHQDMSGGVFGRHDERFKQGELTVGRAVTADSAVEVYGLEIYGETRDSAEQKVIRQQHEAIEARLGELFTNDKNENSLLNRLAEVGVDGVVQELTREIDQPPDELLIGLKSLIEGGLSQAARDEIVRTVIIRMGLSVQEPAQWSWRDPDATKRLRGLESIFGCKAGEHGYSIESELSRVGINVVQRGRSGSINPEDIQRNVESLEPDQLSKLTLNGWLLAYQLGLLDSNPNHTTKP